ncbi:amidohydrolase [Runella sp.]|uniref:amidohydrolase n=1 Tax=Runella sp. TaxID=1960881 RepID=UPI0030175D2C
MQKRRFIFIIFLFSCISTFAQKADLIFTNATIITVQAKGHRAAALAISENKILATGSNEEVLKLADKNTKIIDLQGKTIVPGFNDAHLHPRPVYPFESPNYVVDLGPASVKNKEELVALLKKKAAITPEGTTIRGLGYQDTKLGGHPTRQLLDQVSTKHPVIITHSSGHITAVNSFVLKALGINKNTSDPAGGSFDRGENGEPNGVCRENALRVFMTPGKIKNPPSPTAAEETQAYRKCFEQYIANGITSITEAGSSFEKMKIYQKLQEEGLPLRINLLFYEESLNEVIQKGIRQGFGDEKLRISGIKVFHGNSLSGRTCWLREPYDMINPATGKKDYFGIPPKRSQSELDSLFLLIHKNGLQIACHSNGDREIEMVLTAIENVQKISPRSNHRHRIEHCSVTDDSLLQRIKKDEMVVVLHSYIYEHGDKMIPYGPLRWKMMHPNRSVQEMGIPAAQHSDSPISAAIPLLRLQSLATRTSAEGIVIGENQRITAEDAIRLWTIGGAFASFEEKIKGSLEEGKVADLVILSEDPTQTDIFKLKDIKVTHTMIDGKMVFESK